jgi:hypothetical protein
MGGRLIIQDETASFILRVVSLNRFFSPAVSFFFPFCGGALQPA